QLPNVPWPFPRREALHHRRRDRLNLLLHFLCELLDEISHQQGNVFATLSQRRDADRKHIQTVKQIAAKFTIRDHLLQVSVGRSDKPNIDASRVRAAQAFEFALLQSAQELRLDVGWDITDFIQEQRALIRKLHASDPLADRACEGTFFVAEQLAFEQARRNRRAVQLDECPLLAPAAVVDGPGNKLFSRAGFAEQQDCRVVGRDCLDQLQDVLERRARPYDLLEVHLAAYLFFQIELFLRKFVLQFRNLTVGKVVFDGNCDLAGGLSEEVYMFCRESFLC